MSATARREEAELRRAEYAVCGAAMAGHLEEVALGGVSSQMFAFSAPREVFSTVSKLAADGKPADEAAVMATLAGRSLDGQSVEDAVCEMCDCFTTETLLPAFVEEVKSAWRRRNEIRDANELVHALEEGSKGAIAAARGRLAKWAEEGEPVRGLELVADSDLVARNSPPPVELVEGLLAVGELALLAAPAKAGKSWFMLQLAHSIAAGVPFLDRETRAGPVVYVNTEVGEVAWEGRCRCMAKALGIASPQVYHACTRGQGVTLENLVARLKAGIERVGLEQVAAVIIDPFYSLAGGIDENSAGEVAVVMLGLQKLAEEVGASVLVAHHTGKGDAGAKGVFDRARGSSAFGGSVDTFMTLTGRGEDGRMVLDVVRRNARSPEPRTLMYDFPLWRDCGDAAPDTGGRSGSQKRYSVETIMGAFLEENEVLDVRAITERTGMSRSTAFALLREAAEMGSLVRTAGGYCFPARGGDDAF